MEGTTPPPRASAPLKKVELHVHLDGAIRPSTAWELHQKMKIPGEEISGFKSFIEFEKACTVTTPTDLKGFLSKFNIFRTPFIGDLDALERMAYEFCEDEYYAGVIYAEVRYRPRSCLGKKGLEEVGPSGMDDVIARISHGLQRGEKDFGVKTRQILCSSYTEEVNDLQEVLQLCRKHYDKGVVGMDLLTPQTTERVIEEAPFVEPIISVFKEAANTGVHRTIHAGEYGSAQAIETAVYKLGSERVGHGYHVLQDQNVYQKCLNDKVHFECCPYSSLMTGSVHAWGEEHPICKFARDGVNFSINSDDPIITGHNVQQDYNLLASWNVDHRMLAQSNVNACNSSFLCPAEKNELLRKLNTFNGDQSRKTENNPI